MGEFIINNIWSIIVVVLVLLVLFILLKLGKKEAVKKIVLALVVQAEKNLGSGTGELKYASVVEGLYNKLPFIITFLFSKKEVNDFIEDAVIKLKDILSKDDVTLLGYDEEKLLVENTDTNT